MIFPYAYYIFSFCLFSLFSGYLLYGALFAAVGSAVGQNITGMLRQFTHAPIDRLPMYYWLCRHVQCVVIAEPDGVMLSSSLCLSIIPFTAPVAMMARVAFWSSRLGISLKHGVNW